MEIERKGVDISWGLSVPAYDWGRYVNGTTGNDTTGTGDLAAPWKTIQKALDSVPQVVNGYVKIYVADGTYAESLIIKPILSTSNYLASATVDEYRNVIQILGDTAHVGTTDLGVKLSFSSIGVKNDAKVTVYFEGIQFLGNGTTAAIVSAINDRGSNCLYSNCQFKNVGNCFLLGNGGTAQILNSTNTGQITGVANFSTIGDNCRLMLRDSVDFTSSSSNTAISISGNGNLQTLTGKTYSFATTGGASTAIFNNSSSFHSMFGKFTFSGYTGDALSNNGRISLVGKSGAADVTGNPTAIGASSLTDATKTWDATGSGVYAGSVVFARGPANLNPQVRYITSNTADTLTLNQPWDYTPTVAWTYDIYSVNQAFVFHNCASPVDCGPHSIITEGNYLVGWAYTGTTPATIKVHPLATTECGSAFGGAKFSISGPFLNRDYRLGYDFYNPIEVFAKHSGVLPASVTTYMTESQNQSDTFPVYRVTNNCDLYGLKVNMRVASGAGITDTFTVQLNGVDTAVTEAVTNVLTASHEEAVPIKLVDGDVLSIKCDSGATAAADVSVKVLVRRRPSSW